MVFMEKKSWQGFSLLEVMAALAILAMTVTSLLVVRNNAILAAGKACELQRVKLLLEQKMGEIVLGIETRGSGNFQDSGYGEYWWSAVAETVVLNIPKANPVHPVLLKKITLTVKGRDAKQGQQLTGYFLQESSEDASEENDN